MKKDTLSHTTPFLLASMPLSEVIEANYKLLPILSNLGIGLGFGDTTVSEACAKQGMTTSAFLLICNIYTSNDFELPESQQNKAEILDIVRFLKSSHKYYTDFLIPMLRKDMEILAANYSQSQQKIVMRFLNEYCDEILNHFDYENDVVFPYVNGLLEHKDANGYSMSTFEQQHSNIDEKLSDLKRIVIKYLPPIENETLRYNALYKIFQLDEDLQKHTFIEDNIIIPQILKLEKQ